MRDDQKSPLVAPLGAAAEKRPWEPPRLVPLEIASTEQADQDTGFEDDGGGPNFISGA